jgi:hypothetical protein
MLKVLLLRDIAAQQSVQADECPACRRPMERVKSDKATWQYCQLREVVNIIEENEIDGWEAWIKLKTWLAQYEAAQQDVLATGLYCQHCGDLMSDHLVTERGGACEPPRA